MPRSLSIAHERISMSFSIPSRSPSPKCWRRGTLRLPSTSTSRTLSANCSSSSHDAFRRKRSVLSTRVPLTVWFTPFTGSQWIIP